MQKFILFLNLRGQAASYYADEDSDEPYESLEQAHGDVVKLYDETMTVLKENIGEHLIQDGQYMQGLMAFSALAYNQEQKETTIFFGRNHDLGRDQKKFLELFNKDTVKMAEFSKVSQLQQYIVSKFDTFKHDIVESNKLKIARRIDETVEVLQEELNRHQNLQSKIKTELDFGLSAINELTSEFERGLEMEFENLSKKLFSYIADEADGIIKTNDWGMAAEFGSLGWGKEKETKQNNINNGVKRVIENKKLDFQDNLEKAVVKKSNEYKKNLNRELSEMSKSIGKVIDSMEIMNDISNSHLMNVSLDSSFDVKKMMVSLSGMVALGVSIGSMTLPPVIGQLVGGIAGVIVGLLKNLWDSSKSKDDRIASRQNAFRESLKSQQRSFIFKLNGEVTSIKHNLQAEIQEKIVPVIDTEYRKMQDVERILSTEIQTISSLKQSIEEKNYGTV